MHQHPPSNDLPHLQPLGHKLEGCLTTAVRCDGAKVSCRLGEEGGGEGQEGRGGDRKGRGMVVVKVRATEKETQYCRVNVCVCVCLCAFVCLYGSTCVTACMLTGRDPS